MAMSDDAPSGVGTKSSKKTFECAPLGVAMVICFNNPELCRTVGQRVGDLAELNGVDDLVMGYCSGSTRDITVGHRISVFFRYRRH